MVKLQLRKTKFAILADIHLGPQQSWKGKVRKINSQAKEYLANFVTEINNTIKPEFVIILGDLVQDENPINDKANIKYVVQSLSKLKCPVHYVAGNHDLRNITEAELYKVFKQDRLYYSFDNKNVHYVVLFSRFNTDEGSWIDKDQLKWLRDDLNSSNFKSIVFVHHGLADQNLKGNPWFEGRSEAALIKNRKAVRQILDESNKVLAVFNSHLHWDHKDIHNSIPYYTIQSLTENEDDKGIASEAYAIVDIKNDKVTVNIKGNYQKTL